MWLLVECHKTRLSLLLFISISNVIFVDNASVPKIDTEEGDIIFEKAFDQRETLIEERQTTAEPENACIEDNLTLKEGSQCLDLLAALHNLFIDDMPPKREIEVPLVIDSEKRRKRETDSEQAAVFERLEVEENQFEKNETNSTIRDLFDFPLPDEEPIFVESRQEHSNKENGSRPGVILLPIAAAHSMENDNNSFSNYSLVQETRNIVQELENQMATENLTTPGLQSIDRSLIWEISAVLGRLTSPANASIREEHVETPDVTINRIETLLTKLLPLLVQMKASVRKTGYSQENFNGSQFAAQNNSKGFHPSETTDNLPIDHSSSALSTTQSATTIASIISNATGEIENATYVSQSTQEINNIETITTSTPTHSALEVADTSTATIIQSTAEHSTSENTPHSESTTKEHSIGRIENAIAFKAINIDSQIWSISDKVANLSKNVSNKAYWREKLIERAPYFVPRDQATWWKAEKRRQQACVLLSSIDVIRQKCCLSLKLVCPEYASVIQGPNRLVDSTAIVDGGDSRAAVFGRFDLKGNGEKRGRRNEPTNTKKNALIADTLSRISSLLSVLIRDGEASD